MPAAATLVGVHQHAEVPEAADDHALDDQAVRPAGREPGVEHAVPLERRVEDARVASLSPDRDGGPVDGSPRVADVEGEPAHEAAAATAVAAQAQPGGQDRLPELRRVEVMAKGVRERPPAAYVPGASTIDWRAGAARAVRSPAALATRKASVGTR